MYKNGLISVIYTTPRSPDVFTEMIFTGIDTEVYLCTMYNANNHASYINRLLKFDWQLTSTTPASHLCVGSFSHTAVNTYVLQVLQES